MVSSSYNFLGAGLFSVSAPNNYHWLMTADSLLSAASSSPPKVVSGAHIVQPQQTNPLSYQFYAIYYDPGGGVASEFLLFVNGTQYTMVEPSSEFGNNNMGAFSYELPFSVGTGCHYYHFEFMFSTDILSLKIRKMTKKSTKIEMS